MSKDFNVETSGTNDFHIVTPSRTYELRTEVPEDRSTWIKLLEDLMNQVRYPLPQQENISSPTQIVQNVNHSNYFNQFGPFLIFF